MKTYAADIIPKIRKYSQKLDNLTILTNQHWVVLNELENSKTVYIFRNTGELLIAINGKVEKAKWEYLGNNSILIDLREQSYLFRHGFFDENILALKIDSKDEYAILINENRFNGELNSINAVINFLNQKYLINSPGTLKYPVQQTKYKGDGYSFKMGFYRKFQIKLNNGKTLYIYQKSVSDKFFIYTKNDILMSSV